MLSFIKTSAIAALTLSLAAGGAFAANHHGHEDRGFSARGPENGSTGISDHNCHSRECTTAQQDSQRASRCQSTHEKQALGWRTHYSGPQQAAARGGDTHLLWLAITAIRGLNDDRH